SLRRYRQRLGDLVRTLSITERTLAIPYAFRQALDRQLELSGEGPRIAARNPGEVFRQYLACALRRLDATIEHARRGLRAQEGCGYYPAVALVAELRVLESGFVDACSAGSRCSVTAPSRSTYARTPCARTTPSPPCGACARTTRAQSRRPKAPPTGAPGSRSSSPVYGGPTMPPPRCPATRRKRSACSSSSSRSGTTWTGRRSEPSF